MVSVQTLENPPEHNQQDDPPEAPAANSRGKATKTTFRVYASSDVTHEIGEWVERQDADVVIDGELTTLARIESLAASMPLCIDSDDLICLGVYEATSRDDAVEQLIADDKPTDRVRIVQLTYAAHVDMWFPVLSVASGYVKDVPAVWEINPVSRIGGR
jgi:hypothetical protein